MGFALAVVYVDDILLASSTIEAEERVVSVISGVVPTKTTGQIDENGGSLSFIGRTISREPHGAEIRLSVNPSYLDSTFADYGVKGCERERACARHCIAYGTHSFEPRTPEVIVGRSLHQVSQRTGTIAMAIAGET